jgi:predicted N-acetyltransferase YhbS
VSEGIEIRVERPADRAAGIEVERRSFEPHGSADQEIAIVVAVRDDEGSFALVAVDGEDLVGHVQFSRGWIGDTSVVTLGPIGVLPERQRGGIGSALIRTGFEEARARGERVVMLLGDPAYYGRFGFQPALAFGVRNPFAGVDAGGFVIDEEDFQLAFVAGEVSLEGEVRWQPAFG